MQRVQDALKAQLMKQNDKLEIELREKVYENGQIRATIKFAVNARLRL